MVLFLKYIQEYFYDLKYRVVSIKLYAKNDVMCSISSWEVSLREQSAYTLVSIE